MLSLKYRLRNKKDIEAVFKLGQGRKEGLLFLKAFRNNLDTSRIGFIVSQKVAKKAVLRNKIKRRLRALIESRIQKIKNGIDLLFVALPGIEQKDYSYMNECIDKLLTKAGCLKNNS